MKKTVLEAIDAMQDAIDAEGFPEEPQDAENVAKVIAEQFALGVAWTEAMARLLWALRGGEE